MSDFEEGFFIQKDKTVLEILNEMVFIDERSKSKSDIKRLIQQGGIQFFHNGLREINEGWKKITNISQTLNFEDNPEQYVWIKTGKKGSKDWFFFILCDRVSF